LHNLKNPLHSPVNSFAIVDPAHQLHRPEPGLRGLAKPIGAILALHLGERGHNQRAAANSILNSAAFSFFHGIPSAHASGARG